MQAAMAISLSFSPCTSLSFSPCSFRKRVSLPFVVKCSQNAADFNEVSKFNESIQLDTGRLSRKNFPRGFVFGSATSAYQVEGMALEEGRGPCVWEPFVRTAAGKTIDNSTADVAVDQYHRYKEDVDIVKDLNFDAYRFSISWSRIFPDGTGKVNWRGVDYYNRLIDYLLERGITPYVNLHHFDLPDELEKQYKGWLCKEKIVKDFTNYADFCFKMFGDRVKNWFTLNEPKVATIFGHYNGKFPPGRCSEPVGNCEVGHSPTEPYIVAHNMILAHASAVEKYREEYKEKQNGRIGIVLDYLWYEPFSKNLRDIEAAERARDFHIGWFLHPIVYGEYPKRMRAIVRNRLPKFTDKEKKMVKDSMDYLGINQYSACFAQHIRILLEEAKVDPLLEEKIFPPPPPLELGYEYDRNVKITYEDILGNSIGPQNAHSSWLRDVPWGMHRVLMDLKDNYGNPPVIVTENGMDDAGDILFPLGLYDKARVDYYKGYVAAVEKAIKDGANVSGYFTWSLLDNFEWYQGYTSRFGIVYVDHKNQQRYPKMSAYWFKNLLMQSKD